MIDYAFEFRKLGYDRTEKKEKKYDIFTVYRLPSALASQVDLSLDFSEHFREHMDKVRVWENHC